MRRPVGGGKCSRIPLQKDSPSVQSSLAAESVAISNGCDLVLRLRTSVAELATGLFLREIVGARNSYSVVSPCGYAPGVNEVKCEMSQNSDGNPTLGANGTHKIDDQELFRGGI